MGGYKQIQFIGYEISTAPKNAVFENGVIKSGDYVGITDIDEDIKQRGRLMTDAILTANTNRTVPTDDDKTLKIFMAPEFYFRGPKGAYEMEQVQQVIESLQAIVKSDDWKDWIFVFGSIVGNSRPDQSDWLLQFEEEELFREVYNVVLVQQGGFNDDSDAKENSARIVMKEFMSDIDFILKPAKGISLSQSGHMPAFPPGEGEEEQLHNYDGLGIFKLNELTFGLEVCLDHLAGRLRSSPQLPGADMVEFQLIPSCGMNIKPYNVIAQNDGYSFNVDGRTTPGSSLKKVVKDTLDILPVNSDIYPVTPAVVSPPQPDVETDKIFANGPGSVRIYDLVDIPEQQKVTGSYKILKNGVLYNSATCKDNDKYIFNYLIEYGDDKKFRAAYLSVTLKQYNYELDRVLLPVDGELFNGRLKIKAEVRKVNVPNGDDREIIIDFICQGDHVEGGFVSFKSE